MDEAVGRLKNDPGIERLVESRRLESAPVGGPAGQPSFLNSVARFETSVEPEALLARLQAIEQAAHRTRDTRWAARPLDLDLLAYDDRVIRREELRVPHPRMSFRPFVLEPLVEVAPSWVHPELRIDSSELLRILRNGNPSVRVVGDPVDPRLAAASIAQLIHLELPASVGCGWGPGPTPAEAARLTIDARAEPSPAETPCGPRLALADCPRAYWREEVRAAIGCVWGH